MQNADKVEALFRKLHEESVTFYEDERIRATQHLERLFAGRTGHPTIAKALFPDLKPDRAALAAEVEREKYALHQRLKSVEVEFGSRPRTNSKDRFRTSILFNNGAHLSVPIFAAGLMADDNSQFENLAGERGNPWILPHNPSEVNIKVRASGLGDYYFFDPWGPTFQTLSTAQVDLWFVFWPDRSALWRLTAIVDLFGFYYLRANDSWYDSKWTRAKLTARIGAYQYFWSGVKSFTLLDRDEENVDEGRIFDDGGWFDTQTILRVGDPVFFIVRLELTAHPQGYGSYSEINFSDGSANYIKPLILLASPV